MPVHDWTRVDAGIFHDFHMTWIPQIKQVLNDGLLPEGFYALVEQHAGKVIADVLTLQAPGSPNKIEANSGAVAVAQQKPKTAYQLSAGRGKGRTLAIRHISNHVLVALVEIVSPANKDREAAVEQFARKACSALDAGCHLLIIDLFPPTTRDPKGLPAEIWNVLHADEKDWPAEKPLTLASFASVPPMETEVFIEPLAVGETMPDMPLFLDPGHYVNVPLQQTYDTAWKTVPAYWRRVVEGS